MTKIVDRYDGSELARGGETLKELVEKNCASLWYANLGGGNLRGTDLENSNLWYANLEAADLEDADLGGAILEGVNLGSANLENANLQFTNLRGANLWYANLRGANLENANLENANLKNANLMDTNLKGANLRGAHLGHADLRGAEIEFWRFPSIRLLSSITLYDLPDDLTLELMRRDAFAHPHPEKFDEWSKGGSCPYKNEEPFWRFTPKKQLWHEGKPQMRDSDLIIEICKSQGWTIGRT